MFLILRVTEISEDDNMTIEPISIAIDEKDADLAVEKDVKITNTKLYLFIESNSSEIFNLRELNKYWLEKKKIGKTEIGKYVISKESNIG